MNKKEDLVGTIIEINSTKYLIDRVFEVEKAFNSERVIEQPKLSLTLIEIKSEKKAINSEVEAKPIQDFVPKEKIKGIAIEFSEKQLHNKVTITKALCKAFAIGIMDAKHLVDNADSISNSRYIMHYEATFLDKSKVEAYIRKIHAELCQSLSCKPDDITISIY